MPQTSPSETPPPVKPVKPDSGYKSMGVMLVRMLLFAVCLGCIVMFADAMLRFAFTPDLGWILQSGGWILDHHQLPRHDIFSWTSPEKPWVLYQWLFEVGAAWGWRMLGEETLIRVFTLLTLGLYLGLPLWLAQRKQIPFLFALLIPSLALFTAAVNISLRPMAITAVFLAAQYLLMNRYRQKRVGLWPLLAVLMSMYALWGNLHTGVVMGLFSLLLTTLGDSLEWSGKYRCESEDETSHPRCPGAYALMIFACFGASLINPYGFGIYTYLTELSSQTYLNNAISELQSPNFHYLRYGIFAGLLGLTMLLLTRARQVMTASAWLHVILFSVLTLLVQRFVVWACLYDALIFPSALYAWWNASGKPGASIVSGFEGYRPLLLGFLGVTLPLFLFWPKALAPVKLYLPIQHGACEAVIPGIKAYKTLRTPEDRLLNDSDTGSCLLHFLPGQKVFIDTRFDFYAQDFVRDNRTHMSLLADFRRYLERWDINTVMVTRQWPAYYAMKQHPDFIPLYEDQAMGIFRKRPTGGNSHE